MPGKKDTNPVLVDRRVRIQDELESDLISSVRYREVWS